MQASSQAQAVPPAPQALDVAEHQLRDQIRSTVREATEGARQAAQDAARDAGRGTSRGSSIQVDGFPFDSHNIIPPEAVDISIAFFAACAFIIVGWPLARAFGRRIERKSEVAVVSPKLDAQLLRIEQAVDAMSIEIERISESQRFMARLQNETAERALE